MDIRRRCSRKKCYSTEAFATSVANRVSYEHRDVGLKLRAYPCECGSYHIGRVPGSPQVVGGEAVGEDYSPCPDLL